MPVCDAALEVEVNELCIQSDTSVLSGMWGLAGWQLPVWLRSAWVDYMYITLHLSNRQLTAL